MNKVFVYGSLKRGFGNHPVIEAETTRFLGVGSMSGGVMYSLGAFPAVIKGDGIIYGELYEVDDYVLTRLDRLEGHPTFYERQDMVIKQGDNEVECQGYVFQGSVTNRTLIEDGDWTHGQRSRRINRAG